MRAADTSRPKRWLKCQHAAKRRKKSRFPGSGFLSAISFFNPSLNCRLTIISTKIIKPPNSFCFFVSQNLLRFLGRCLIFAFNLVGHSPVGAGGAPVSSLASYSFEFAGGANQPPGTFFRLRRYPSARQFPGSDSRP